METFGALIIYGGEIDLLITALVQHKGNTLVVNLPRDRMDLEVKLRSVGIQSLSDKVHIIDDDEKSDISVKLFSESDMGQHLSLLFKESNSLYEVNRTLMYVENSDEDIHDDLEMKIVHDQYDTPAELVADINRMTDAIGRYTENFYFPLKGNLEDEESFWSETSNHYLREFKYDIREKLEHEQDMDGENMKDYFYDDNAQKKMVSCRWDVVERDGTLYGKVEFRLKEPFTAEEKEKVLEWITGQNADGLGEGFEQRAIETEDGDLYVSMWDSGDDYFVYDEDEMNDYLAQQQSGGISL